MRIARVLANLLDNAFKYSPADAPVALSLIADRSDGGAWAVLTVRDNGLGIPPDDLPHIFERFYRGSNVRRHTGGNGIGLAGARQIVEQHGGTIDVTSQPGVGTLVTVRLPLQADPDRPAVA
jgi:two-component system, OmpR family, sensor kinase